MYTILVIEQDVQFLSLLEEWLTLYGFHSITTNTTCEGYKLACLKHPDLILCGYGFPSFDGLKLLQAFRNRSDTANIPFLLMTGALLEDIPNWQTYLQQGELLLKPFDLEFLIQILNHKLQSVQA